LAVAEDPASAYQKLVSALARRAARFGSSDPECAAQEAVKRSLASPVSRHAIEYYFHESGHASPPEWSLLQLLGWLHGVLRFVVREERARARFRRETSVAEVQVEPHDPAPDQLTSLIDGQLRGLVHECLRTLNAGYRSALLMRLEGVKYADIAIRLGVNENTVATWVRRGSHELTHLVRERLTTRAPSEWDGDALKERHV
jgi:DNA-directed RNA polymerase specialized sigma24 family protein